MAAYCLDTNVISDVMAGEPKTLARLEAARKTSSTFISVIVRGEVLHGIGRLADGKRKANLLQKANKLLAVIPCEPLVAEIADEFARIKTDAQRRGLSLTDNDLWIAATSLIHNATLVTRDGDFSRGAWTAVENWAA